MVLERIETETMGEEMVLQGPHEVSKAAKTPITALRHDEEHDENGHVVETSPEEEEKTVTTAVVADGLEERDFDKNPTVLFALLQKKEWKAAMERSHLNPEESRVWVSRKEKDGRLRWRLLPIHAAIVFKAPENVIQVLLGAYPQGAQAKDDQGMLPLHLAFRNGSSEEVVNHLLVAFPQSIDVKDRKGRIPLVLAQASTSPNKDAFLRALERGPAYYAVAAAESERAAVTAEQRAIFDAKLHQVKQTHQHELTQVKLEAENKQRELQLKIEEMQQELIKTQETSQVLVDHVNSLEAQLNSRSDTERFLATKIATLDSSLKNTEKGREELENKLKLENFSLIAERDGYKSKLEQIEAEHAKLQEQLKSSMELFERREQERVRTEAELQAQVKSSHMDWANAQANCAILDAQLKKKLETEHALATQVSSLAGKLAESASESRENTNKYTKKIRDMEEERLTLRQSVQDLTKRLKLVARVLEDMTAEQNKIIEEAKEHEYAIASALESHANIVADAHEQQMMLEQARREREQMRQKLAEQEAAAAGHEEKRATIMTAIVAQGQHMERTKNARADMLASVANMGNDVKGVLAHILAVLPKEDGMKDEDLIDAVVNTITNPELAEEQQAEESQPAPEEEKKEDDIGAAASVDTAAAATPEIVA